MYWTDHTRRQRSAKTLRRCITAVAWIVTERVERPLGLPEMFSLCVVQNSERSLEVSRHLVTLKTVIVLQKAIKERNNTNVFVFS